MNTVRWGIVGAGDVCERKSGPPLYELPGSELVLVHRRDRSAGEDFCRRHAGRYVESFEGLVASEEIDAVYVASPHALHAEHTIAALAAGKHVLVEKPMATSAADCTRMIDAAERAGRSLAVAYYRRGYPSVHRVRELLRNGEIGRPVRLSINGEFPTSHRLDLVQYLLGPVGSVRPVRGGSKGYAFERMSGRIEARVGRERPVGEDATAGKPAEDSTQGVLISMSDTWTETGMPEALVLEGERGAIHLSDLKGGALTVHATTGVPGAATPATHHEACGGLRWTHWGLIENFVAHLRAGEPLLCDGAEGRRSTVILDALAAAQESGNTEWTEIKEQ